MSLSTTLFRNAKLSTASMASVSRARFYSHRNQSAPVGNAPGWSEDAATSSEAGVKADRNTDSTHDLQQKTVDHQHKGSRADNDTDHASSDKNREESSGKEVVKGPLADKGSKTS